MLDFNIHDARAPRHDDGIESGWSSRAASATECCLRIGSAGHDAERRAGSAFQTSFQIP